MIGPLTTYVQRAVGGTFRLAWQDPKGLQALDLTADGFFRSFLAIALSAPLYAMFAMGQIRLAQALPESSEGSVSLFAFVLLHVLNFVGGSILFLVAMAPLSRLLELTHRYTALAIVYNWGTLAIQLAYMPLLALFGLGVISARDTVGLSLLIMLAAIVYRVASFRAVLMTPWTTAMSLALVDILIQGVWFMTLRRIFAP